MTSDRPPTRTWMSVRRWASAICIGGMLLAVPGVVAAHAELVASEPAGGGTITAPPAAVELTFNGELDPDGSAFTVTGPGGGVIGSGEVDLGVADRNVMRGAVDPDGDGIYQV